MIITHDVAGHGPALLLLHSSVCDRRMWDAQWTPLLSAGYQLVRCDFRGFGQTPLRARPHNDADDVLELLDALGIEQAAFIGSSYGGRIALETAARWPDRVSALALLCAGMPGHKPSPELQSFNAREDALIEAGDLAGAVELNLNTWLGPEADDAARELVRRMQRHSFEVQLAAPEGAGRATVECDLGAVQAPCLAVSGGHDFADFQEIAAQLADLLPDAHRVELPWAGHLPSMERPTDVTDLLIEFLHEKVPVG